MESKKGFDNYACHAEERDSARVEMNRMVSMAGTTTAAAGCCNGPTGVVAVHCCGGDLHPSADKSPAGAAADVAPNARNPCQPKCPAVRASPWDPTKTRFALFLTAAMVVWLLLGLLAVNFSTTP